jgi:hypothetical protein
MAKFAGVTQKAGSARAAKAPAGRKAKRGTGTRQGTGAGRATGTKKGAKRQELSESTAEGGAHCLKEAVDRELKSSSEDLAKLFVKKAGKGDLPTLRLLVSLAEQHEAKEPDPGPLRSQALAWAMEPQWVDPPGEGDSEAESQQADEPPCEGTPPVLVDRDGQILKDENGEIRCLTPVESQGDTW